MIDVIDDMALPQGKTCGDCAHWRRCSNLIDDLEPTNTTCDFAPSRFKEFKFQCTGCKKKFTYQVSLGCNCGGRINEIEEDESK